MSIMEGHMVRDAAQASRPQPTAERLHRLVYVSQSVHGDGACEVEAEVASILAVSQANNRRAGITGALLFSSGWYAQTLEGPIDHVTATFERIQCDPRHRHTVILQAGWIERREFDGWSMGYVGHVTDDALPFMQIGTRAAEDAAGTACSILDAMRGVVLRSEVS